MEDMKHAYLCGGVVLSLIVLAKAKGSPHKRILGESDSNNNSRIMLAMQKAFAPRINHLEGSTLEKNTSNYLNCKKAGDTAGDLVFNNPIVQAQYDAEIKKQNPAPVDRMAAFVNAFVMDYAREWLLKAMLELLESDESIGENAAFYITGDGRATTKARLRKTTSFCLEAFLTGIFHFILTERSGGNQLGADTLERYQIKDRTKCTLGNVIARELTLRAWKTPHQVDPGLSEEEEGVLAEGAPDEGSAEQAPPAADSSVEQPPLSHEQPTLINHQTILYQNAGPGGKNILIEHVDTLQL